MDNIQSLIDRLENIDTNFQNPLIPATIHVEALKEILPEVIKDLKDLNQKPFLSVEETIYNADDIAKAWNKWIKDANDNPNGFIDLKSEEATGESSFETLIFYLKKL